MLGFLSTRYHHRFDWSEQKVHTLSDQSRKVLEGLEQDVAGHGARERGRSGAACASCSTATPTRASASRSSTPTRTSGRACSSSSRSRRSKLGEHGLVRVAIGGESVEVSRDRRGPRHQRDGEAHAHGREGRLLRAGPRRGRDRGRGRPRAARASRAPPTRCATRTTASSRCCSAGAKDVPEDADVVIVAGAKRPLFDEELAVLDRYLARGGALFALVDPRVRGQLGRQAARVGRRRRRRHRGRPRARRCSAARSRRSRASTTPSTRSRRTSATRATTR